MLFRSTEGQLPIGSLPGVLTPSPHDHELIPLAASEIRHLLAALASPSGTSQPGPPFVTLAAMHLAGVQVGTMSDIGGRGSPRSWRSSGPMRWSGHRLREPVWREDGDTPPDDYLT